MEWRMPHKKKKKIRVNYDCVNQGDGGNYTFEERFPLIRNRVPLLNFSKKIGGGGAPFITRPPWNRACARVFWHRYAATRTPLLPVCTRPDWKLVHVDDTTDNGLMQSFLRVCRRYTCHGIHPHLSSPPSLPPPFLSSSSSSPSSSINVIHVISFAHGSRGARGK